MATIVTVPSCGRDTLIQEEASVHASRYRAHSSWLASSAGRSNSDRDGTTGTKGGGVAIGTVGSLSCAGAAGLRPESRPTMAPSPTALQRANYRYSHPQWTCAPSGLDCSTWTAGEIAAIRQGLIKSTT